MGIAAKDLFKRDLVDDARVIEAALPVGKGDRTAAPEPRGDGWNLCRIGDHALSGKHQILIDVLALQCGQTARSAGNVGERHALRGNGGRRQFQNMHAVFGAARAVPDEPVVQGIPPFRHDKRRPPSGAALVPMLSRFCECGRCHGARPV